jgi:hypothetical protein
MMQDFETICPYPGLRPFTEEESLYFKGREEQIIKLTGLLEEKKFLMVTGASGDGKSSLIYGGLIPQARAGFFKAQYSNWHVAGFRPERSPMKNMAESLARQLGLDTGTTTIELSRGFSSLVELYKSSSLFLDKGSRSWMEAGEEERNRMERQAGNLLIIIDQFEEFFTNPENFTQGVPSKDSGLLLNIILETSKISLRDNLPIYVVCTMRSDYIGQCAAFRGLPEFIGFSQFFVPRLQRRELQQAIEIPAILSGNRISKRLTDRLISDLEEGIDQLPILQHALKQIWKAADQGLKEMDLIHYAMVGGMDGEKLPEEDLEQFRLWSEQLPEYEKKYLNNAGLSNVLDIHANKLYEEAATYYNRKAKIPLTIKDAKLIIGLSFSCLTRIDENRAVRNRMTLKEITNIINIPEFTSDVVEGVLRIFREPENTLVRPFLEQAADLPEKPSGPETVLDITHEALIRNWQLLKKWAGKEYEYYSVFLDLKQQLNRWIDSSKSTDYLLPIGPLTYFENWYKECRPNKYWINRYSDSETSLSEKIKESESTLHNLQKFLRKSALHLLITRTFMKYGATKIARATALVIIAGLIIYLLYSWNIRRNDVVIRNLINEGSSLLNVKETASEFKADFLLFSSRLDPANITNISREVTDNQTKIDISLKIFERLYFINRESDPPIRGQALAFADSLISQSNSLTITNVSELNKKLNNLNDLVRDESYYLLNKRDDKILGQLNHNTELLGNIVFLILTSPDIDRNIDIKALNIGIENILNFRNLRFDQVNEITNSISPFKNDRSILEKFQKIFPANGKLNVGFAQTVSHNGGYEKLAYLYAASGDVQNVLRCIDSLNKYNERYDQNWNNTTNIAGYFLMYGHTKSFQDFTKAYSGSVGIQPHSFVRAIANLAGIREINGGVKFIHHGNYNENLNLFDYNQIKELFGIYRSTLQDDIRDKNELNFNLALSYKQQGVVYYKICRERDVEWNRKITDSLFSIAWQYYSALPAGFTDGKVEVYTSTSLGWKEKVLINRSQIFLYPDHFKVSESSIYEGYFLYYGDIFFNYLVQHDLIARFYHDQDDYKLLTRWISSYFEMYGILSGTGYWNRAGLNYLPLSEDTFLTLDSILVHSGYSDVLDDDWINLKLANVYFGKGDTFKAFERVKRLKFLAFNRPSATERAPFYNMQMNIAKHLAIHGEHNEAIRIIEKFSSTKNKLQGYSTLAVFTKFNGYDSESEIYQDSSLANLNRVKFFRINRGDLGFDYRTGLVEMFTLQDNRSGNRQARENISAMEFEAKLSGVLAMVRTQAMMDNYYDARSSIPGLANPEDRLRCITAILYEEVLKHSSGGETAWSKFDTDLTEWLNYTEFIYDLFEY